MKAFLCDGCEKAPAAYGVRVRGRSYFEGEDAVSEPVGDFCKNCWKDVLAAVKKLGPKGKK